MKTRSECDARSVSGCGLAPAGPVLTMPTAWVLITRVGSTAASFRSCVPPTIRYAATPATASSKAKPVPMSLGAQDPRDRARALRLPRIPNDYRYPAGCARGCCEKLRPEPAAVTLGNRVTADLAHQQLTSATTTKVRHLYLSTRFAAWPCDEVTPRACWPP